MQKRAKKCTKNKVTKQAKLVDKTVYYACRATVVHENITNGGLFQLGDGHSLVTATMSHLQNLGRVGRGRGQGLRMVDEFSADRPSAANEEQPEIWDDSQDVPPFTFPCGAVSAMDSVHAQSQASPGLGSLDGVCDKRPIGFCPDNPRVMPMRPEMLRLPRTLLHSSHASSISITWPIAWLMCCGLLPRNTEATPGDVQMVTILSMPLQTLTAPSANGFHMTRASDATQIGWRW